MSQDDAQADDIFPRHIRVAGPEFIAESIGSLPDDLQQSLSSQLADSILAPGSPAIPDNICDQINSIENILHSQVIGPAHRSTD